MENRLARIQAIAPTVFTGGGISGLKVKAFILDPSPLYQRNALVVTVHQQGNADADREIDTHSDRDHFNGLASLVEHGTGK
ncbi:hypothetical protein D3C73_1329810 [compost metagenome]